MRESEGDREQKERAALRIMEALSGADEELLEKARGRAEKSGKMRGRRPVWQYGRTWAAALCLLTVGALSWGGYRLMTMRMGNSESDLSGGACDGGQEFVTQKSMALEEDAALSQEEGAVENGAAPEDPAQGGAQWNGQEKKSEEGESQEEGRQEEGQQMNDPYDAVSQDQLKDGRGPEATVGEAGQEVTGCPAAPPQQKLTEAQARESGLGDYVPEVLPAGYVFDEASLQTEAEDSQSPSDLRLTWSRGMDYITLHITRHETQEISVVDVNAPETYDQRLYEIPLGDSVPREYWESVQNPVFAAEDLSLEVIETRMVSMAGDSGDTDTPRGNFAVLYSGGVLVEFSGRGTAEEIWNMFEGLE